MGANLFEWQRLIRGLDLPAPVNNIAAWVSTYANADGTKAHPGVGELRLATGLSRDSVVQSLAALRDVGLLLRVKRGGGRGSRLSDEYELTVPDGLAVEGLEKLVADAYESARPTRKTRGNESAGPTSKPDAADAAPGNESDLRTYESDMPTYESAGPTPPPLDTSPLKSTTPKPNTSTSVVTVEGPSELSGQDLFAKEKAKIKDRATAGDQGVLFEATS